MKSLNRSRLISLFSFLALFSVILPIHYSTVASAASDPGTLLLQTTAQITYSGSAQISPSVGISQDIQIQQPTIDFGPSQPILWNINVEDSTGSVLADINWFYSATSPSSFTYQLVTGSQVNAGTGGSTCVTSPASYCSDSVTSWTLSDPMQIIFAPNDLLGANWWYASITDLQTGTKLDLGSIKDIYPMQSTNVKVQDSIYRGSVTDNCPGDAAPVADTYFGPVLDTSGGADLLPNSPIESHACVNSALANLPNYVGGFMLYGGSKADISSPPRANLFTPSPLITSAVPPTPDEPNNFIETAVNGVLSLSVQIPNLQSKAVKSVYLVAPALGFPPSAPINTTINGSTATISFPVLPGFIDEPISMSFYASNGYFVSDPLSTTITIPSSALPPVQIPGAPNNSTTIPTGIIAAPTTISVPLSPAGVKASVVKGQLLISANVVQKKGMEATGALLVSPALGFTSSSPKQSSITGGKVQYKLALSKNLSGKNIQVTLYFYNKLGVSKPYLGKIKLP
jgi:hypothetical protein